MRYDKTKRGRPRCFFPEKATAFYEGYMKISQFKFLDYYKKDFPQDGEFTPDDIDVLFYYKTSDFSEIHSHNYWEIMVMCENSLINSIDGNEIIMSGFDMFLVKPANVHFIKKYKCGSIKYYNFEIRESWLKSVVDNIDPHLYDKLLTEPNLYLPGNKRLHEEVLMIVNRVLSFSAYDVKEKQELLRMLIVKIFVEMLFEFKNSRQENDVVDQFIEIMRKPENMGRTLKDLSGEIGYCIEHLIRQFKKKYKKTPNDVFIGLKMNYACNLLDSTDLQIIKIAEMVGFSNVNYFDKVFHKTYGISPREYRNRNIYLR